MNVMLTSPYIVSVIRAIMLMMRVAMTTSRDDPVTAEGRHFEHSRPSNVFVLDSASCFFLK